MMLARFLAWILRRGLPAPDPRCVVGQWGGQARKPTFLYRR